MAGQDSYRPWGGQTQCGVALGVTQGRCGQGLMAHGSWPALPPAATRCRHRGVHSQLAGCLPASLWLARGNLCGVTARPSWATHLGLWGQWALPPCAYTADFTTGWDRMSRTQAAVITTDVTQPPHHVLRHSRRTVYYLHTLRVFHIAVLVIPLDLKKNRKESASWADCIGPWLCALQADGQASLATCPRVREL